MDVSSEVGDQDDRARRRRLRRGLRWPRHAPTRFCPRLDAGCLKVGDCGFAGCYLLLEVGRMLSQVGDQNATLRSGSTKVGDLSVARRHLLLDVGRMLVWRSNVSLRSGSTRLAI